MVLVHEVTAVIDISWGAAGTRFEQVHEVIMSMHAAANAGVHQQVTQLLELGSNVRRGNLLEEYIGSMHPIISYLIGSLSYGTNCVDRSG